MKPLATTDTSFLFAEGRSMPMHTGGLLLFSYPPGAGEAWLHDTISDAVTEGIPQPPFNQKLAWPLSRFGRPHWIVDDELDIHYHVRHSALPKPGRYREMFALISRLHSTRLHRDRPLWEMHVIEGVENDRFAMYFKMHHSMIDGVGGMRLLRESLSPDPNDIDMPAPWAMPRKRPAEALESKRPDRGNDIATVAGALRGIGRYVQRVQATDAHGMVAPFQAPMTMFNRRISGARRFVAQSYALSRIKAVGKAFDATVNDIVLAMSAGALRSYLLDQEACPKEPLTAMTPVSIRPTDAVAEGNAFSAIFATLATDLADPVERLRAIQRSMAEGKGLLRSMSAAEIPIYTNIVSMPVMLPLVLNVAGRSRPSFNVTVSNVPGPREPLYWNGARLEGMYPLSIVANGLALNITVTSCADSLDFGIVACRRTVPSAQRLIDHLETALQELETAQAGAVSTRDRVRN